MKRCTYCGKEYGDEASICAIDCEPLEKFPPDPKPANPSTNLVEEEKTATVEIYQTREAAGLAAGKLEAYGIFCWLKSDDGGGMMPYLTAPGGVRLLVRASDAEAAIALLKTETPKQSDSETNVPSDTTPENKNSFVPIGIFVGIIVLVCLLYLSRGKSADKDNLGTATQYIGATTQYHYGQGGKPDEAWIYQDRHLMEYREDRNGDGNWDHWVYYEHGQEVRSDYDNNFDGKPDEWWTFSDNGRDTLQKDTDFNGIPDEFCTYKYRILQYEEMKPNGSKFATEREFYKNGVLTEILRGGDSNGNFKEDVRYDPFFNPISTNVPTAFQSSPAAK